MEQRDLFIGNKNRLLRGFRPGGIGMHGTFRGYIPDIQRRGLLLPSEKGLPNVKDNVIAYYTTPSQELIRQTVMAAGEEYAADILLDALVRQLKNNVGYAQNEGFGDDRRQLDWSRWQETPEFLPAIVFFKDAGEVQPVGFPGENAAKGSYISSLAFPEMRSMKSIEAKRVLGNMELTPEDVGHIQLSLSQSTPSNLRSQCEQLLISKAFEYLISKGGI